MKQTFITPATIILLLFFAGCNQYSLKVDESYRELIGKAFTERYERYASISPGMSGVMQLDLSEEERLGMEFMYAFMPLSDLADYSGEFHLANVKQALKTRYEMPWGKNIPSEIFLHFVLPQRINNENLDSFRIVYYKEIADRVKGMDDIVAAALEINHWCHEKVSYQPSDIRTSAPMSTILSARGRCGEESTFTVAALRCAGIPARQVYTPRWAHSDDNHAWVEVWVEGEWKYMGACEPEPVLDRGWFTEPARRAMLIHTKVFGKYTGSENTIFDRDLYSEINNLGKYAITKDIVVKVLNSDGTIPTRAEVEFQLYNYAEFYPLAIVPVDKNGIAVFRTGLGDLLVWAREGQKFSFKKITVTETDTLALVISENSELAGRIDFDLFAPLARTPLPGISKELIEENAIRLKKEDSIRQSYIDSWRPGKNIQVIADENNLDPESVQEVLKRSMGNYREIMSFLEMTSEADGLMAMELLKVIAEKDLRDTPSGILMDHLKGAAMLKGYSFDNDIFNRYVLSPRIANEIITAWRSAINSELKEEMDSFTRDPGLVAGWIKDNIKVNTVDNYYKVPISPVGVLKLGQADELSLRILYVAICRSAGIPSRLAPGTMEPQYYTNGQWIDARLSEAETEQEPGASLMLEYTGTTPIPEYYTHFTIAKFEDGRFNTLNYPYNKKVTEFSDPLELQPGRYMIVTGNRLDDTRILTSVNFFSLKAGETVTMDIRPRTEEEEPVVLGRIDMALLKESGGGSNDPGTEFNNGVVIAWIEKGKEPSVHILNDLPLLRQEFDEKGIRFLFIFAAEGENQTFTDDQFSLLPSGSSVYQDKGKQLLAEVLPGREPAEINFPYIVYADGEGKIMFRSEGYRIGIGEQILKRVK